MAASQELVVPFRYGGREFVFHIWQRELNVGLASKVRYYWMNSAQLRQGNAGPNFRPCIDLWWHAGVKEGRAEIDHNLRNRVLAEFYPLINTSKGMQSVYVDAHLSRNAGKANSLTKFGQLSTDECQRLRTIASTRDWKKVRVEFEHLFLGEQPSREEIPAFNEFASGLIDDSIAKFKEGGQQALLNYLADLDEWIVKLRRQSGIERVHRFLNRFSYECKIAFYKCYCSAWVAILWWLKDNPEPNVVGNRMMRMWHNQGRRDDIAEDKNDVFHGQVLALHPLSAFMHSSPEHLTTIGQWFGRPDYDKIVSSGKQEDFQEYWQLVGSILIAAHEYSESRIRRKESRGNVSHVSSEAASGAEFEDTNLSRDEAFEQVAAVAGHKCSKCDDDLKYIEHAPPDFDKATVDADFRCKACGNQMTVQVSRDEMRQVLRRD